MEKEYRLEDVEDAVYEMEDLCLIDDEVLEKDEDHLITSSGWWVHIPELGLNLHEGLFYNYDEDENDYLQDFSITVIREEGQAANEYLYYEQDGFLISLANFMHGQRDIKDLMQLPCYIRMPKEDGPDLHDYVTLGIRGIACVNCGADIGPDDPVMVCADCGGILCKKCIEHGALTDHECDHGKNE